MITGVGIVAFRDMHGIRPIVYGARETDFGEEFVVASESVAIDVLGFNLVRDIRPGEVLFINSKGELFAEQCVAPADISLVSLSTYTSLAQTRLLTASLFIRRE